MNDIDLRTALHEWAGESPAGQPPIAELISRGAHRRRRRTLAGGVGVAAAVVLAAGALATSGLATTPADDKPALADNKPVSADNKPAPADGKPAPADNKPQDPRLELAAATTATSEEAFRFVVDSEITVPAHDIQDEKGRCSGVLDPATQTGYVRLGDLNEHWAIDGKRYLRVGKHHYTLGPGAVNEFIACPIGRTGDPGFVSADPASLLRDLSTLASVRKITGGETSTYAYTGSGFHGTVTVHGGRVRLLTSTVDSPARGDTPAYHRKISMALSGYGEPVEIRAPW